MTNQVAKGSVKSKTMLANGSGIAGLLYLWNDPMLAMLPDKAKYIILAILGANMILRYFTTNSLSDKGKTEPDKILENSSNFRAAVRTWIIDEVQQQMVSGASLLEHFKTEMESPEGKKRVAKILRAAGYDLKDPRDYEEIS